MNTRLLSLPLALPLALPLGAAALLLAAACTAPRAITTTGKVTPQGEFRGGYNLGLNLATAPLGKASSAVKAAASQAAGQPRVNYSADVVDLQAAAIAYLLDPVQPTSEVFIRYGVLPRLDAGYKYTFGSHVFDAQYQFLGPVGSVENPGAGAATGTAYASVGLQFATQRANLPSLPFLNDIQSTLNFSGSRHDLLVPLTVSHSFGPEEEIGAISYGLAYGHSWVRYGFAPANVYLPTNAKVPDLPSQSRNFSSFGAFVNLKLGYRYFYVVPALSVFYQNYGDYALLNKASTQLSGATFVPSLGFQLRAPKRR